MQPCACHINVTICPSSRHQNVAISNEQILDKILHSDIISQHEISNLCLKGLGVKKELGGYTEKVSISRMILKGFHWKVGFSLFLLLLKLVRIAQQPNGLPRDKHIVVGLRNMKNNVQNPSFFFLPFLSFLSPSSLSHLHLKRSKKGECKNPFSEVTAYAQRR